MQSDLDISASRECQSGHLFFSMKVIFLPSLLLHGLFTLFLPAPCTLDVFAKDISSAKWSILLKTVLSISRKNTKENLYQQKDYSYRVMDSLGE